MKKTKQKKAWQSHPGTNTEHFFPDTTPGALSTCRRSAATTGEFHTAVDLDYFICSFCRKKLQALAAKEVS